jgi:hypothetical protein
MGEPTVEPFDLCARDAFEHVSVDEIDTALGPPQNGLTFVAEAGLQYSCVGL